MTTITALHDLGIFDARDLALASTAESYAADLPDLPFVTAWLSCSTRLGHVCLPAQSDFSELAAQAESDCPDIQVPDLQQWFAEICKAPGLSTHPFVGDGARRTPIVLDGEAGHIYLHRWFAAEQRLVAGIRNRAGTGAAPLSPAETAILDSHFPPADNDAADQRRAVETAVAGGNFSIVAGGPGTGKTTAILALIDVFAARLGEGARIALCAPTGKAVARVTESIRGQIDRIAEPARKNTLETLFSFKPASPVSPPATLHRLLGANPQTGRCRRNAGNPLPHDLLVVDESSMIDLLLLDNLLHALKDGARIVMVGDKNQLPAVGSGTVFADLCAAPALQPRISILAHNWRAKDAPDIVDLAAAVNDDKPDEMISLLEASGPGLAWHRDETGADAHAPGNPGPTLQSVALPHWKALRECTAPQEAFAALARFQLLCAVKRGPFGVRSINEQASRLLGEPAAVRRHHGQPILVTVNDPDLGLYNGDLGIVLENPQTRVLEAWFPATESENSARPLALSRLPAHDPAYAMTVHKAQGSEAEEILLVLPDHDSRVLVRELLYTGITRAKKKIHILAPEKSLRAAAARTVRRISGITEKLPRLPDPVAAPLTDESHGTACALLVGRIRRLAPGMEGT